MADSPLPYATPRRELVRQCCEAALMWYRVFGDLSASRDWLNKARMWRDHYAREIEANNAFIRANPAIAARWKLRETQPHPESHIVRMTPPNGPPEYWPERFGHGVHEHATDVARAHRFPDAASAIAAMNGYRWPPAFWESERRHAERMRQKFAGWKFEAIPA